MLTYKVKNENVSKLTDFDFDNLYLSPDLSFISGTTDHSVGLVDGERIAVKTDYLKGGTG